MRPISRCSALRQNCSFGSHCPITIEKSARARTFTVRRMGILERSVWRIKLSNTETDLIGDLFDISSAKCNVSGIDDRTARQKFVKFVDIFKYNNLMDSVNKSAIQLK